jgi:dTDP-alpha-D-glucuronic acid decarboxylase
MILITGVSGFVGFNLSNQLIEKGYEVKGTDIVKDPLLHPKVKYSRSDITAPRSLARSLTPEIDTVVHLAAIVGVKHYLADPLKVIEANFLATLEIARTCAKTHKKLVFASTSEVYGKNPAVPWKEDDDRVLGSTAKSRWTYGSSKALAEHAILALTQRGDLEAVIFRLFNLYGAHQAPVNVVARSVARILTGKSLELYDKGDQTRCFTYVDDAVDAIVRLMENPKCAGEAFNIGSNVETTMMELMTELKRASKIDAPIDYVKKSKTGSGYEDIPRRVPAIQKIRRYTGWKGSRSLRAGLPPTLEWYSQHRAWWGRGST